MINEKLVSIIMPAYNAENTIADSIKSVLEQEYNDWELIIINDCSVDLTELIAINFTNVDDRIKLISLKSNVGLPSARNKGIAISKGHYIAFLDSDDIWMKKKLSLQVEYHQKNKSIKISHTNFKNFNSSGVIARPFKFFSEGTYRKKGNLFPQFLYKNIAGILTVMIDRNLLLEMAGFDENLWGLEDQDLWIRISEKKVSFGYLNKNLSLYRINSQGMMKNLGRYKKAYKALITKHYQLLLKNNKYNISLAIYYNYFGSEYYKKTNYKLSTIYFLKSLTLSKFSSLNILSFFLFIRSGFLSKLYRS